MFDRSSQLRSGAGLSYVTARPGIVMPEFAIFSKVRCSHRPGQRVGFPLGFVHRPEDFPREFERIATPSAATQRTLGLNALLPEGLSAQGAWVIKPKAEFVYLVNTRQMAPGGAPILANAKTRDQEVHVEQVTVRFEKRDWVRFAPDLFLQTLSRISAFPAWGTDTSNIDTSPMGPLELTEVPLLPAFDDWSISNFVIDDAFLKCESSLHPLATLLGNMPPEELERQVVAYGWRTRLAAATIQVYPSSVLCLPDRKSGSRGYLLEKRRAELRTRERETPTIDAGAVFSIAAKYLSDSGESAFTRECLERLSNELGQLAPGKYLDIPLQDLRTMNEIARLLDFAFDLTLFNRRVNAGIFNLAVRFINGLFRHEARLPNGFFELLSWMEFAPSFLSGLQHSKDHRAIRSMLGHIALLREEDPDAFLRLTAKMDMPDEDHVFPWPAMCRTNVAASGVQLLAGNKE